MLLCIHSAVSGKYDREGLMAYLRELRDCTRRLIALQLEEAAPESALAESRAELDRLYEGFVKEHGRINSNANRLAFSKDQGYYLLCALEVYDDEGNFRRKADMFTKRTVLPQATVDHVDTASEALAVSIGERARVDLPFMARLAGRTEEQVAGELRGVIFQDPIEGEWQTAGEYLSGDVRQKLRQAREAARTDPAYQVNVEALEKAQPRDLDASEIVVNLGATWIDPSYIQQFMEETFQTPRDLRPGSPNASKYGALKVNYHPLSAEWAITHKNAVREDNVAAYKTFGTKRASAYRLLEDALNLRDTRIYDTARDPDGKERRVLNGQETAIAAQKQQAIQEAFREWLWKDPGRREALVHKYNEEMNCIRPREYDGSCLRFVGMDPEIRTAGTPCWPMRWGRARLLK